MAQKPKRGSAGIGAYNTTVDKTVEVLLQFSERDPVRSAAQISSSLGLSRSTAYRYIRTLQDHGLIERADTGGGFRLGPRVFDLARAAGKGLGLSDIALPIMRSLADRVQETVLLIRRSGDQAVCVEQVEGPRSGRISWERGHSMPLHAGASSRIVLAFAEADDIDRLLRKGLTRFTANTPTDPDEIRRMLAKARSQGFDFSDGEVDEGVRGVAVPVTYPDGRLAAGLTVAGLSSRLSDDVLPSIIKQLHAAANEMTEALARTTF